MDRYLNRNLIKSLDRVEVCQGTAKDSGNIYYYVNLVFINGYEKRIFINDDQKFALQNAFELIDVSKPYEE